MFSKYSVKKPYTVIVGIILVIVLGYISFQHMTTDLLPSMDLPYVVVYTPYTGATPERVEADITRPMEAAFATLTDVKKITSSSRDNVSVVIMQFNDGADMDTALIEISSSLDRLRGGWDDDVGAPVAMKLNPDLLPVTILSVSRDDMDILALSDYVEEELVPAFEGLNGVASANASGVIEQRIDVTIEQSRIDVLNKAILKDVDAELADVEKKLDDAQGQLSKGKRMLSQAKKQAYKQLEEAEAALEAGAKQIPAGIEQLKAQREELALQRESLAQTVSQLDGLVNMDQAQKDQLLALQQGLAALKLQREDLEKQLAQAQAASADTAEMDAMRAGLIAQRDALQEQIAQQTQYLSDLKLLDPQALQQEISALEASIAGESEALEKDSETLEALKAQETQMLSDIDALSTQITQMEESGAGTPAESAAPQGSDPPSNGEATSSPTDAPTDAPADSAEADPTAAPTDTPADSAQADSTVAPTEAPTDAPTESTEADPTDAPAESAEADPTVAPTDAPAESAQADSTVAPTDAPAEPAETDPTDVPTDSAEESAETPPAAAPSEPSGSDATAAPAESASGDAGQATADGASDSPASTQAGAGDASTGDSSDGSGASPAQASDDPVREEEADAPAAAAGSEGKKETEAAQSDADEPAKGSEPGSDADTAASSAEKTDAPEADTAASSAEKTGAPETDTAASSAEKTGATEADTAASSAEKGGAPEAPDQEGDSAPAAPKKDEPTPAPEDAEDASNGDAAWRPGMALAEDATLEDLKKQLSAAQERLTALQAEIATLSEDVEARSKALEADRTTLQTRQSALDTLSDENEDIQSRMDAAQAAIEELTLQSSELDGQIAQLDAQQASLAAAVEALEGGIQEIDQQIAAIEGSDAYQAILLLEDPEGLNAQYVQAQEGLTQMDAGLAQMDEALEKLNSNIIPGGFVEGIDEDTDIEAARGQLTAAREQMEDAFSSASSQLKDAEGKLAKARKEFNEQRDEALENAGLDGVITMQTVSGLIGAQNISMPAGYVYDAENEQVLVRVGDKFDTLDGVRRMKLFELNLDSIDEVRLLDVARVELTDNSEDVFTKLNGQDGILLSLDKQSTYSTADVADTVMAKARALAEADPNLHIVDLMNQGEYIDIIVDSVLNNLMSGGGLAILILLLFLMDFRPTITVAFSIPISVVIAFVCMYFSGITLNVLSLSGLSLGIGMLVDNSIVAIENIYRLHDEEGVPLLRACVEGVRSVSGALFSSTLTTICVFLPIVFVQGMARDLFADMGLTIAFSLLASLFVAMTVVPAMCSFLMRRSRPKKHRIFGALQRFYGLLLRGALRFKPLVLLAALALLAFSAMQIPKMGISFMPQVNSRQMSAELNFDREMTDRQQKDQAMAIMNDMMQVDGVDSIGLMGSSSGSLIASGGGMSYYINIDESRGRKNADIAREMSAIGEKYGADLSVSASTMDISMLTGSGISVEITGDELDTLQAIALDIAQIARDTEGVVDVDDGLEDAVPELRVEVDKEKAVEEGLTTGQVLQFVAQKVSDRVEITQVTLDGKELGIYLQDGASRDLRPEDLEDLEIEVDGEEENKLVRLGDVAQIRDSQSLSTISRANQRRLVTVSFAIAEGYSANLVSDAFEEKLKAYPVPSGYSADLAGENETVMGIMEDLVWMLLVAILLIFLIMVAQFQSFKSPIIVMFTIPLAFTGGLLALLITGMDLSIVSMLGFLVLSGVVVNNGIVFIDCVNQLRIGGMEKREALLETGRIRLRPILMTALTTILGMSTMALGHGTGAEMMQPMAVVSIGGLTYATLMTLFIVPVLYDLVNGKTMRAREIQMIKEAAGMIGDEALDDDDRVSADAGREAPAAQTPDIKSAEPAGAAPPPEPSPVPEEAAAEPAAPEAKPAPEAPVPAARPLKIRFRP